MEELSLCDKVALSVKVFHRLCENQASGGKKDWRINSLSSGAFAFYKV